MSADTDLEILKNFVMDGDPKVERDSLIVEPDNEVVALGDVELMAPIEDAPVNVIVNEDIETLRVRMQAAEVALAEAIARAESAENSAADLQYFKHSFFTKLRRHSEAGGNILFYPLKLSEIGRAAIRDAAKIIYEIDLESQHQKYVPIFEITIADISTQNRSR